jgi:oligopeptide transport system permease protein
MPVVALTLLPIANTIRVVKGELSEEMESKYVLLLRTKGLTKWQALTRHALKNSLIPVLQDVTITFGLILTMGFLIEMTYNVHGIAYLFYQGMIVPSLDYNYFFIDVPLATMTSAFYAGFILIISFISDMSVAFLDPRINIHGKKV